MLARRLPLAALAIAAASCSGSSSGSNPNEFTFTTEEFTVQPGDYFECHYTNVTSDHEMSVNNSYGLQGQGGHHIVVYYTDDPKPPGHHECVDAEMTNWHQVAGSAGHDKNAGEGIIGLPAGYAIKVPAGKQFVIQSHYINVSGGPMTVKDSVTLELLDPSQVKAYANALVMVDDQFAIPPHAQHTRQSICRLKRDYQMLLLLGHMHEWGKHFTLDEVDDQGNVITTLYDQDWAPSYTSHPPVTYFKPEQPLSLKAGTRLRQTCTWDNGTDASMKFPREMCVMFGYYFPDQGFDICEMDPLVTEQ